MTRSDLSTDETFAWMCGSFGVLLILLLSSALTLRTFVARDKYVLVAALMGVAPIFAATPPRRFSWIKQGNTSKVFLFINLLFILCGSLWLGATAVRPYVPRFNPRALSLAYVVSAAVILVCARRAMVKGSERRWLDAVNAVLLFVTPLALVSLSMIERHVIRPAFERDVRALLV